MNKSEILFLLRNHYHRFNQNELKFVFENVTSFERDNDNKLLVLIMKNDQMIDLFDDGDVEWYYIKDDEEFLHNDFGLASTWSKQYMLHGECAMWDHEQQRVIPFYEKI